MKNKMIGLIILIGLLSIYPTWRYLNNAKAFGVAIINHASGIGAWTYGSIHTGFDGVITINNLQLTPTGHNQTISIGSVKIETSPLFLFKTSQNNLSYTLPETLSISVNAANLGTNHSDILDSLQENSLWMLQAGYAGSFGCQRESFTSFDKNSWNEIITNDQVFNLDLYYSKLADGSLDIDLILDAEELFSSTWSSNLKSSYHEKQITINELIADKIYYYYLDNGFNLKRNNACKQNYKSSFSAYRLSSAEHLQNYLRARYSKELPKVLINWYQRMLAPDVEYNAIISLKNRKYLSEIYHSKQNEFYTNATIEVATTQNDYLPVSLKEIDFTNIDTELLKKVNQQKQEHEKEQILANQNNATKSPKASVEEKLKPTVISTGSTKQRMVSLNNINSALNKRVRIKTLRGRPITGFIRKVDKEFLSLDSRFKTGHTTLTIPVNKISSIELVR